MSKTYTFRQEVTICITVQAENEESAYEMLEDIDPLTGDLEYQEPELEYVEDENGKVIWNFYQGDLV
jgi:hypothetical protein